MRQQYGLKEFYSPFPPSSSSTGSPTSQCLDFCRLCFPPHYYFTHYMCNIYTLYINTKEQVITLQRDNLLHFINSMQQVARVSHTYEFTLHTNIKITNMHRNEIQLTLSLSNTFRYAIRANSQTRYDARAILLNILLCYATTAALIIS